MSNIKIAVACHKPSELPKNELFLPIHVGAALTTNELGLQKDSTGDNISAKNPQYCELTAQYWLWKNVEADYYGLCHYRRFLCFRDVKAKRNLRKQIEASVINAYNLERFGLEDSEEMRAEIEANDVVTGELQDVKKLYTPVGNKTTAYEHWAAHDRALIMKKDLDRMLTILDEVAPEIGADAREYLAGKKFLGFNCFVMKRQYFQELCGIEFAVLEKLEEEVNLETYCQQLTRIYGFMAEIISSAYIYHLEKLGKKVAHKPLVYFNYTDPQKEIKPQKGKQETIPVFFNAADNNPVLFGTTWQSFLDHLDPKYDYDVNVLLETPTATMQAILRDMASSYHNVMIRFIDMKPYRELYAEKYALKDRRKKEKGDERKFFSPLPFLPFIFTGYDKALVCDENIIFCDGVSKLWSKYKKTKRAVAAPNHAYMQARVNDRYFRTAELYLKSFLDSPLDYFSINVCLLNFAKIRSDYTENMIAKAYVNPADKVRLRSREDVFNMVYAGDVEYVEQRWNTWLETSDHLREQLPYLPLVKYRELLEARKNPGVISYLEDDPFLPEVNELYQVFWNEAQKTVFYTAYIQRSILVQKKIESRAKRNVTAKLFPVDKGMRGKLNRVLPQGTKRHAAVKSVMNRLGIS